MPIVLISESLLRRRQVTDGRILRDRQLCGFCVRMNAKKRSFRHYQFTPSGDVLTLNWC